MDETRSPVSLSDNHIQLINYIKMFNDFLADKLDDKDKKLMIQRLHKYGDYKSDITHISYLQYLSHQIHDLILVSNENSTTITNVKKQLKVLKDASNESATKKTQYEIAISDFNKVKHNYEIITYEQLNELIVEFEKSVIRTIPYRLSPIFLLGRVTQQLLVTASNLEEQCYEEDKGCMINSDALNDCDYSFLVAIGLINTTLVQSKKIKEQFGEVTDETTEADETNEEDEEEDESETENNEDESVDYEDESVDETTKSKRVVISGISKIIEKNVSENEGEIENESDREAYSDTLDD